MARGRPCSVPGRERPREDTEEGHSGRGVEGAHPRHRGPNSQGARAGGRGSGPRVNGVRGVRGAVVEHAIVAGGPIEGRGDGAVAIRRAGGRPFAGATTSQFATRERDQKGPRTGTRRVVALADGASRQAQREAQRQAQRGAEHRPARSTDGADRFAGVPRFRRNHLRRSLLRRNHLRRSHRGGARGGASPGEKHARRRRGERWRTFTGMEANFARSGARCPRERVRRENPTPVRRGAQPKSARGSFGAGGTRGRGRSLGKPGHVRQRTPTQRPVAVRRRSSHATRLRGRATRAPLRLVLATHCSRHTARDTLLATHCSRPVARDALLKARCDRRRDRLVGARDGPRRPRPPR